MTWQKTHLACAQLSSTYKLRDEWFVYNTEFLCREKQLNFYLYIHSHEKSMMEMKKCFFWLSLKIRKKCSSNWSNLVPLYTFTNEMVFLHAKFLQKCSLQVSTAQSASLLPWAIFSLEQNLITWLKRTEGAWGVKKKGRWGGGKWSSSYNLSGVYIHMHCKYLCHIMPKTRNRTYNNPKLIPDQICHTRLKGWQSLLKKWLPLMLPNLMHNNNAYEW